MFDNKTTNTIPSVLKVLPKVVAHAYCMPRAYILLLLWFLEVDAPCCNHISYDPDET